MYSDRTGTDIKANYIQKNQQNTKTLPGDATPNTVNILTLQRVSIFDIHYIVPAQYTKKAPICRQGGIRKGKNAGDGGVLHA